MTDYRDDLPLAESKAWITSICPLCKSLNWFSISRFPPDGLMDFGVGDCFKCSRLFWVDPDQRDDMLQDLNDYPRFWEDIKARGGLEGAFRDGKCITGASPFVEKGRAAPEC